MTADEAPQLYLVVPKDYGNQQPASASSYWVNIEQVEEYREAETANSYLQHFTLEVWVWVSTPERIENAAKVIASKLRSIYDALEYNSLGGFARTALDNESLGRAKYVKGPVSTNARYGAHFTVKIATQVTVGG
ncbi:MAG TPA: hypothetical protein PLF11_01300 [Bacillota bacterium]|nr:hypothetical protein [Bacillota bacterium]